MPLADDVVLIFTRTGHETAVTTRDDKVTLGVIRVEAGVATFTCRTRRLWTVDEVEALAAEMRVRERL